MSESIHGHEVIHFIQENDGKFTKTTLLEGIAQRFGHEARFHTCSAADLTADQLLGFLATKGKLVENHAGFVIQAGEACSH